MFDVVATKSVDIIIGIKSGVSGEIIFNYELNFQLFIPRNYFQSKYQELFPKFCLRSFRANPRLRVQHLAAVLMMKIFTLNYTR